MTIGAPAVADLDAGTITRSVRIAAPREVVWTALTTPEHLTSWWGHPTRFADGFRPGTVGIFEWSGGDFPVRIDVMDAPSRFGLTWGFGDDLDEARTTHVVFDLVEDDDGTVVTVTETGFDKYDVAARRAAIEDNVVGWNQVLDSLATWTVKELV